MERDLNFKRLLKMYIRNLWLVIFAGLLVAVGLKFVAKGTSENVLTKSVYLVYDLEESVYGNLEAKKNTYFDAYKGLIGGNTLQASDAFTEEEKGRLDNMSSSVESSCYTITLTVPNDGNIEKDQAIFDKFIAESEKWMKEKFNNESIQVAEFSDSAVVGTGGVSTIMVMAIGFVVGAILVAMCLFIWFVLDRKIRTEEDVVYYTGVECFGRIKRRR